MEPYLSLESEGWMALRERGSKNNHGVQLSEELIHSLAVCG